VSKKEEKNYQKGKKTLESKRWREIGIGEDFTQARFLLGGGGGGGGGKGPAFRWSVASFTDPDVENVLKGREHVKGVFGVGVDERGECALLDLDPKKKSQGGRGETWRGGNSFFPFPYYESRKEKTLEKVSQGVGANAERE